MVHVHSSIRDPHSPSPHFGVSASRRFGVFSFTLTELMLVVAILAVLITIVVAVSSGVMEGEKRRLTQTILDTLELAVSEYYEATGTWPYQGASDMSDVVENMMGVEEVSRKLQSLPSSVLTNTPSWRITDGWGRDIVYEDTPHRARSLGADGEANTADDLYSDLPS